MPPYTYLKALHIIFMTCWFAGLFFIGRMFIYHIESQAQTSKEAKIALQNTFELAEKRVLYIIIWPALVLTTLFGLLLAHHINAFIQPWFHIKMTFIALLIYYTTWCHQTRKRLQRAPLPTPSIKFRLLNEVPALLLIAIVFTVYSKDIINTIYATIGLVSIPVLILLIKKWRQKEDSSK